MPHTGTGDCSGVIVDPNANTADLEIKITVDDKLYKQYEKVAYKITVTNNGPADADEITVAAGLPDGMVYSDAEVTQGRYRLFFERWEVGALASGESATLDLILFTLVEGAEITNFVQVMNSNKPDPDSTPGNDNDDTPDEDDEAAVTIVPFENGGVNTGDGVADLSISIMADNADYEIYEHVVYTITVTNDGPDGASGIFVNAGLPAGMVYSDDAVTTGDYSLWREQWTIDELPAGSSATLTLTLFTLVEDAPIDNYVQVFVADQGDPDSTPGNNPGPTPTEDDEAVATITPMFNGNGGNSRLINPGNSSVTLDELYPVPVTDQLTATFTSTLDKEVIMMIYGVDGKMHIRQQLQLNEGFNQVQFELSDLPAGMYFLDIPVPGEARLKKKFVKANRR